MKAQQFVMPDLIPDSYWVTTCGHRIFPDGTRFLVVEERPDGLLRAWRDGMRPLYVRAGTILRPEQIQRREDDEKRTRGDIGSTDSR